ncbi:MAG: response regulator [Bryobacteraceae bacterium]
MDPRKSHKVLVVEDEGLIALDICGRLRSMGHEVVASVGTAAEAIEKASEADIVLMDIRIDGHADGVEAAQAIRERFHVPVVFLTAHADRATLERAKSAGPFGYVLKPLAHASLKAAIEIALYKHGMERRLEERQAWLAAILSAAADAVIAADANGRVLMLNRAAEMLTGWIEEQALGEPISKIVRLIEESSCAEAGDPVALAMVRDAPVAIERSWKLVSRGGREMRVEGSAAPVKISSNPPLKNPGMLGVVLTLRDVSARDWEERPSRQT